MACQNCVRGYCQFHEDDKKFSTGLQYTKPYQVYDLRQGQIINVELREQDRRSNPYIEIEEKTATCTRCRRMDICNNYFVTSRSGTANVCICTFCISTKFANEDELFSYVKSKLRRRYRGTNTDLLNLLTS